MYNKKRGTIRKKDYYDDESTRKKEEEDEFSNIKFQTMNENEFRSKARKKKETSKQEEEATCGILKTLDFLTFSNFSDHSFSLFPSWLPSWLTA